MKKCMVKLMNYIIDFSLVSIAYLWITAFFYRRQPKIPSTRNSLFGILLYLGVFFALMDVLTVIVELYAGTLPTWLVFLINTVFLLSIQLSSALFLTYCLALTGIIKNKSNKLIYISLVPFYIVMLLLLLPLGKNGIFYLDANNIYHRGALYAVLYIDTAFYLITSLVAVIFHHSYLRAKKLLSIFAFLIALFAAMIIQYIKPEMLLNATANAIALTLIYHVLEAPSAHIDALTGVLNKSAFHPVLDDLYEQENRSTLLLFHILSVSFVNNSLGIRAGDVLLTEFAAYLKKTYPAGHTLRVSGNAFAVVLTGGSYCGIDELNKISSGVPEHIRWDNTDLPVEVGIACINSEDTSGSGEMTGLAEYILMLQAKGALEPVTLADDSIRSQLKKSAELELRLEEAVASDDIEVFYQPIHDCNGKLTALEALVRIRDGGNGFLPTQEAVETAEKTGSIHRLGNLILRRVCEFIRENNAADWGLHHIGVNLSALQFMHDDLCENVSAIMDEYGVSHSLVAFEITETASASVTDIADSMREMNEAGYSFLLDDFGKGYANIGNIAQLPLICVKIDKMLLWEAIGNDTRMAFLKSIVRMFKTMDLVSVCEGVETKAQSELLGELGVDMQQGYYFSKPLPPDELLSYINRRRSNEL